MPSLDSYAGVIPATIIFAGSGLIGIARFLDSNLTDEWRDRIAKFLRTGNFQPPSKKRSRSPKPWQIATRLLSNFFSEVLRSKSPRRFLTVSVSVSVFIIAMAFSYFT